MEKPFKENDKITRNWVEEAGLLKPSSTFSMEVFQKIEAKSQRQTSTPLITTMGWVFIASVLLVSVIVLYVYPSEISVWQHMADASMLQWKESMDTIKVSDTSFYAFVFLSLFLLQLPVLKKIMDKQLE
jgi:hypothetical protein